MSVSQTQASAHPDGNQKTTSEKLYRARSALVHAQLIAGGSGAAPKCHAGAGKVPPSVPLMNGLARPAAAELLFVGAPPFALGNIGE